MANKNYPPTIDYFMRKANQHWEMAGLARMDGDNEDCLRHTNLAREWERKAREL